MAELLLRIGFKVAGCVLLSMQETQPLKTLACSSIGSHSTLGHSASLPAAVRSPGFLPALASGLQQLPPPVLKICMLQRWQCHRGSPMIKVTQPTHQPTNQPSLTSFISRRVSSRLSTPTECTHQGLLTRQRLSILQLAGCLPHPPAPAAQHAPLLLDWESQYLGALCLPPSSRPQPRLSTGLSIRPTAIAPTSLEDMYASEMAMSPRFTNDQGHSAYSPAHKSAILNKLHQQKGLLSPVNTNRMYSPRALDPAALVHPPIGGMSPRSPRLMEPTSPMSARFGATVPQREMYEQFSNLNKHQLPSVGSPRNSNAASWGNVGSSPMGKVDWGVDGEELDRLRCPDQPGFAEKEPDAPWGRSLNSNRGEMQLGMSGGMASGSANRPDWNNQADLLDQMAIGAWLEQLQTDQK
uniref:Uncharacterized protein n=1 Tax=Triticum urartu TaxID=4572 RepID=A0A8R7R746_TRIUA